MQTKPPNMNLSRKKIHLQLKYLLLMVFCLNSMIVSVYSQERTFEVTGIVSNVDGEPLPGASVLNKGTIEGTITSFDGTFSISCTPEDILSISFVGYESQDIAVKGVKTLHVILTEDLLALDEVVVVGYGTMRKQDLTGSISSVSGDELNKGVITTTEQVLQGKIAGLAIIKGSGDPTTGATMRLRGGTSLTASSSPLVVVDGIPGVDINSVQPSDIASIDVLKDASAAAIYGSRGANGVILITTNRPERGGKIEYSNYVAFSQAANSLDLLTAEEWRTRVIELEDTRALDFGGDTNWQDEILRQAISHSHTLAFSNANDDGGYRASLSYMNNQGIMKFNNLERIGAKVAAYAYGLNGKLKVDFGTHATFDDFTPSNGAVFERAYNINPTAPVYDSITGEFFQTESQLAENPLEVLTNVNNDRTTKRLLGYAKADLEIVKGLNAVINTSYEFNTSQGRYYLPTYSRFGLTDRGYASRYLSEYTNLQLETYLTYNKELSGGQRFNVLAGYSYLDNMYEGFNAERRSFDTDLFKYNNLIAGIDSRSTDVGSYKGSSKLISFFGRFNYSYQGRYILTATLRRDGSSRFGANNKWGLFPSVAGAWRISDESFMSSTSGWLNHLKLRAGYGITGSQDAIGNYKTIALLSTTGGKYYDKELGIWRSSYLPSQNPNPDLRWETTSQVNIGLDISVFNRVSATVDVYKKVTSDLIFLYAVSQPPNIYNETLANVGDLSNKGVEISIDWNIIHAGDLRWDLNLSMARNILTIDSLSNNTFKTDAVQSGSLHGLRGMSNQFSQTIREGYSVGTFWGPECFGLDSLGKFVLDTIDSDLGNPQPKFTLGLNTTFTYKQFDLTVSAYGMFGQKVLNATAMSMNDPSRFSDLNVPDRMFNEGIDDDPTFSSYWIEDASFVRLQALTLGYTFQPQEKGFQRIRLFVSGENLFVLTRYTGLDPEISIETYNSSEGKMDALLSPGIDRYNVYPKARTFTAGINLTF